MLECFVNCFLKALVDILDWQGLGEFGWAFGDPSTKICIIEGGPPMNLQFRQLEWPVNCFLKALDGITLF